MYLVFYLSSKFLYEKSVLCFLNLVQIVCAHVKESHLKILCKFNIFYLKHKILSVKKSLLYSSFLC